MRVEIEVYQGCALVVGKPKGVEVTITDKDCPIWNKEGTKLLRYAQAHYSEDYLIEKEKTNDET